MRTNRVRTSRAFTLIESLVVVAILVLLLSIMLPSLARARDGVYMDICQNNLRNIMQGAVSYSLDHTRLLPSPNWGGYAVDAQGWTGGGWLYQNKTGAPITDPSKWNADLLKTGNLFPYISAKDSYRCPRDPAPHVPFSGQLTSYNMNGSAIAYATKPVPFAIGNFAQSSVLFWEVDAENFSIGWWWDGGNYPWEGLSQTRHYEGGTVVSVDLSTDRLNHLEYYKEEVRKPGKLWNVPGVNGVEWGN